MEPPRKPVLIYDGECRFCCHFVEQWKRRTGDRVQYEKRADAKAWVLEQFYDRSAGAVLLMMPDGRFFEGAEAVFKVRAMGGLGLGLWFFDHFPGVRALSGAVYKQVANHRPLFSWFVQKSAFIAGSAEEWIGMRWILLRGLAVVYAVAFLSMALQIRGLVGQDGILPAQAFLDANWNEWGWESLWRLPTLCWLNASDGSLLFLAWGGVALAVLLFIGRAPAWVAMLLWLFFLSLVNVGRDFLSFQWDTLLLEAGFLAIFLAPWRLRGRSRNDGSPSLLVVWLFRLLTARFMFTCGLVKWTSGDPVWRNLTALDYHYFTQPLPTWLGWYANQLPAWFQAISAAGMFGIELGLPLLVVFGRRGRWIAFLGFFLLQSAILFTGNHAYFNWLTLVICLSFLDDQILERIKILRPVGTRSLDCSMWQQISTQLAAALLILLTLWGGASRWLGAAREPALLSEINDGWHLANGYGVFASMTTRRPELIIEGSEDGVIWKTYEFKNKPGDLHRRPAFIAPFQPRLDWQMWFVGVGTMRGPYVPEWFTSFLKRLLEGSPEVLGLLKEDPFAGKKPEVIRVKLYDYEFTTAVEKKETGDWWKRKDKGLIVPEIGLDRFR